MKTYLLATVSGIVLMGAAQAADLPVAFKTAPMQEASWAGFYVGVQGGVVQHEASFNDMDDFMFGTGRPSTLATSKTGGLAGGYAGYNLQDRSFVYGVEADTSWVGAKAVSRLTNPQFNNFALQQSHDISWLATFRGRAGLSFDSTLVYLTGGLAVAGAKESFNRFNGVNCNGCFFLPTGALVDGFSLNHTQVGWTAGVGFEHMLDRHWTVRGEARYVALGRSSTTCTGVASADCFSSGNAKRGEFSNTLMTGTVGVGYKF
jgi:outer membrane immunogenic protein